MEKFRTAKEMLGFLAIVAFFGGSLLFSEDIVTFSNSWDDVALYAVRLMSGLGLGVVLVLGIIRLHDGKQMRSNETCRDAKQYE